MLIEQINGIDSQSIEGAIGDMPVISGLMQVGVAYTTVEDFDNHIVRTRIATFKTMCGVIASIYSDPGRESRAFLPDSPEFEIRLWWDEAEQLLPSRPGNGLRRSYTICAFNS